jgi:ABC-2 type transport system permease protein
MSRKRANFRVTFGAAVVLLLAIAFLLTGITTGFTGARADLTSDHLYTMAPAAKKILGELKVPVQVHFYVTPPEKMPTELRNLQRDVTDKLRDYERASDGMLQYSVHFPQDDDKMQDDLVSKGIRPFQVQSVDKDEIGVKLVWSAISVAYKDYPEEIIPQVLPQSLPNLEYELISRVYRLTHEEKPKIAMYAPKQEVDPQLAMMYIQQGMQPPEPRDVYSSVRQLLTQEHYEVAPIELTEESGIPADADVLLLLDPGKLTERQVFEVNRALSNGLPTIVALQAHTYDYSPAPRGGFSISASSQDIGLAPMLEQFGVKLVQDHFMDSSLQVLSVPRTQNIGGLRLQTSEPVRAPIQVLVTETQMSSASPLTNRISSLLYLWGTPLELNDSELSRQELTSTVLMTSSDRCWTEDYNDGTVPGSYFRESNRQYLGPQPLAVMIEGEFPDSFQGRSVPDWSADLAAAQDTTAGETPPSPEEVAAEVTPLTPTPTSLVVIGCAKMFSDDIIQAGQNSLLLLNAVDDLAHGEDLISIRAKMLTQRAIRPVTDGEKLFWRILVTALVPAILAIYGLFRFSMRRKEARQYRQQLALRRGTQTA